MKILLAVLCILVVILLNTSQCESFAGVSLIPPPLPPRRSGCYYEPEDRTVATGETFKPKGRCMTVTCREHGNFDEQGCPLASFLCTKNPRIEREDPSKPYPDCCEKLHCD